MRKNETLQFSLSSTDIWAKVFKNGPSKIGRQPLKNLK